MPKGRGSNPNSIANLRRGNPGNKGGVRPSERFRQKAKNALDRHLHVMDEIIDRFKDGDASIKATDALRALEMFYKWSGQDVTKIAQTNADGDDIDMIVDDEALEALLTEYQATKAVEPILTQQPSHTLN